jgi:peptidoglycan/xylan/chitin deacetylase (PgdA/CDA1 family)
MGRLIRLLVSGMLALGRALITRIFRGRPPGSCVVVNYHSIGAGSKARFLRQLDLLQRLTRPVPAAREMALDGDVRYVAITADDAFCSFLQNGLPELCRRRIPILLFVPTGYLGRRSAWEDYGGENKVGEEVASADDLKRMAEFDTVDFGSHSVNHPDLALLSENEARKELRDSKEFLEELIGREVTAVSFPYGSYGARELRLAREVGYKFCFDSTPQSLVSSTPAGLIGRVSVQPTDWDIEFKLKISGAYRWVRWASLFKRRMVSWLRPNRLQPEKF